MMDEILFRGSVFEIIERTKTNQIRTTGIDEEKKIKYEFVRRAPGVRAIVVQEGKVLLNREYRYELNGWDYRLPGGKVFDTLNDYLVAVESKSIEMCIKAKLCEELREEAEIEDISYRFLEVSHCGFTVEWDLYYFLVQNFKKLPSHSKNILQKTEYEFIEHCWIDYASAYTLCLNRKISEARSALVLLNFLLNSKGEI